MPKINYLAHADRLAVWRALRPVVEDMGEEELRQALLLILQGREVYDSIDESRGVYRPV